MRDPRCNLQLEQGGPSYGWRRVTTIDGGWAIDRTKKEGRKSYGGVWYSFYGKPSKPTVPRDGRAVLHLHLALDLFHHGPIREGVRIQKRRETVHGVLLLLG